MLRAAVAIKKHDKKHLPDPRLTKAQEAAHKISQGRQASRLSIPEPLILELKNKVNTVLRENTLSPLKNFFKEPKQIVKLIKTSTYDEKVTFLMTILNGLLTINQNLIENSGKHTEKSTQTLDSMTTHVNIVIDALFLNIDFKKKEKDNLSDRSLFQQISFHTQLDTVINPILEHLKTKLNDLTSSTARSIQTENPFTPTGFFNSLGNLQGQPYPNSLLGLLERNLQPYRTTVIAPRASTTNQEMKGASARTSRQQVLDEKVSATDFFDHLMKTDKNEDIHQLFLATLTWNESDYRCFKEKILTSTNSHNKPSALESINSKLNRYFWSFNPNQLPQDPKTKLKFFSSIFEICNHIRPLLSNIDDIENRNLSLLINSANSANSLLQQLDYLIDTTISIEDSKLTFYVNIAQNTTESAAILHAFISQKSGASCKRSKTVDTYIDVLIQAHRKLLPYINNETDQATKATIFSYTEKDEVKALSQLNNYLMKNLETEYDSERAVTVHSLYKPHETYERLLQLKRLSTLYNETGINSVEYNYFLTEFCKTSDYLSRLNKGFHEWDDKVYALHKTYLSSAPNIKLINHPLQIPCLFNKLRNDRNLFLQTLWSIDHNDINNEAFLNRCLDHLKTQENSALIDFHNTLTDSFRATKESLNDSLVTLYSVHVYENTEKLRLINYLITIRLNEARDESTPKENFAETHLKSLHLTQEILNFQQNLFYGLPELNTNVKIRNEWIKFNFETIQSTLQAIQPGSKLVEVSDARELNRILNPLTKAQCDFFLDIVDTDDHHIELSNFNFRQLSENLSENRDLLLNHLLTKVRFFSSNQQDIYEFLGAIWGSSAEIVFQQTLIFKINKQYFKSLAKYINTLTIRQKFEFVNKISDTLNMYCLSSYRSIFEASTAEDQIKSLNHIDHFRICLEEMLINIERFFNKTNSSTNLIDSTLQLRANALIILSRLTKVNFSLLFSSRHDQYKPSRHDQYKKSYLINSIFHFMDIVNFTITNGEIENLNDNLRFYNKIVTKFFNLSKTDQVNISKKKTNNVPLESQLNELREKIETLCKTNKLTANLNDIYTILMRLLLRLKYGKYGKNQKRQIFQTLI